MCASYVVHSEMYKVHVTVTHYEHYFDWLFMSDATAKYVAGRLTESGWFSM